MNLPTPAKICFAAGLVGLALVVINQALAPAVDPALERAAVLASFLAVGLMLVAVLWTRAVPEAAQRAPLSGEQGFGILADLGSPLAQELAWGSHMLLTASPAAVVLVLWQGQVLLRRGVGQQHQGDPLAPFPLGEICARAQATQKAISLVDLKLYPGRSEFDPLLEELPSVLLQPLGKEGMLLLGGWSARCFSRSDLAWAAGWAEKLRVELEALQLQVVQP